MMPAGPPAIRRTRSNTSIDNYCSFESAVNTINLPELPRDSTQPAPTAHMLPPRAAASPPMGMVPPMVRRAPSVLNMSFFAELGQMAETSDDDTRRLLGKFSAEADGPTMPPQLKRLVSGEASGPPKMTRSNSAYLREMAQASSSSSSYPPMPPPAIDVPPGLAPPMVGGCKSSELLEEGLNLFSGGHLPNFSFSGVRARARFCARALHPRPAPTPCTPSLPNPAPGLADFLWGWRLRSSSADRAPAKPRARLRRWRGGGEQASCGHAARYAPGEPPPLGPFAVAA